MLHASPPPRSPPHWWSCRPAPRWRRTRRADRAGGARRRRPQPLTPEAGGAPPDCGPFTIDRTAWETWGGAIQSGDLSQVLRPESIGYTGAGIPFSLGILSTTDGFGSALAAQPATIVRGLTGQTLLNSRLFIDPAVNFGANMAADGAVIYGVDHLGRELQAANGWFLTERGRQYVQYANTLPPGSATSFSSTSCRTATAPRTRRRPAP